MKHRFESEELVAMYTDSNYRSKAHSDAVVKAFRKRMQMIVSAVDDREFYRLKSAHYEKLKGKRSHQRSMKLNDQYRLILELEKDKDGNIVVVIGIEDYHD